MPDLKPGYNLIRIIPGARSASESESNGLIRGSSAGVPQ